MILCRAIPALVLPPVLAATAVAAQGPLPAHDGWVTDLAGFLEPQQERALEAVMESYKQGSGNEIALLTVPDLGGRTIERLALEVARAWGIGERGRHNGALLVVSRDERKLRIEVGRGLEGTLTDSISGRIIRDVIVPELEQGRYYDGLRAGVEAMHRAAGGDYAALPARRREPGTGITGLIGPAVFVILMLLLSRRRRRGGILPWLLLGSAMGRGSRSSGWHGGSGGGFGGFGGGGGFSGGGASGSW